MQKNKLTLDDFNSQELNNTHLPMKFEVATLKLQECAHHTPGKNHQQDQEILALESELMSLQELILEKATKIQLQNEKDFLAVKKLWQSVIKLKHDNDLNLVDQLAVSLFQYIEQNSLKH